MALLELQRPLAFVFGGGGARSAFQVGALRALFEAGIKPDILVGTSIGGLAALVQAHGIPVHTIELRGAEPLSILDFNHAIPAIELGYTITRHELEHGLEQ